VLVKKRGGVVSRYIHLYTLTSGLALMTERGGPSVRSPQGTKWVRKYSRCGIRSESIGSGKWKWKQKQNKEVEESQIQF
jgi:hypothetical protein